MQAKDIAIEVGNRIRSARLEQGLRQEELALVAGVSTRTVHQVESGKPTSRFDVIVALLYSLGLTLEVVNAPRGKSMGRGQ